MTGFRALVDLLLVGLLPVETTPRQALAGLLLVGGALLVGSGLVRLIVREARKPTGPSQSGESVTREAVSNRRTVVLLSAIVAVAGLLRLHGLAGKALTHTEALLPNIPWPSVSFPPARFSFYDTFWWHFHSEGHPQAYAFLMWAWTRAFGTGLDALRMPSVLFGVGCVVLVYGVGRLSYDKRVGLLSAALLAFNGLHLYWSQYARMYAMGCFLALLSTLLLLLVVRGPGQRRGWEAAYVGASWLAAYTQTFFWPVLAAQALWVTLQPDRTLVRRVLTLQALVVALGASSLAHTAYLGDDVTLPGPSWSFVGQYLAFGFLFEPDLFSIPARYAPPGAYAAAFLLAIGCLGAALGVRPQEFRTRGPVPILSLRPLLLVGAGSALVIGAFALLAHRRNLIVAVFGIVPLLAIGFPAIGARLHDAVRSWLGPAGGVSLPLLLALVPAAIVVALSFWTSMLAPRAFLMFVPFLLIVLAAGFVRIAKRWWLAVPLGTLLVALHVGSVLHFQAYPTEQIDYADLGHRMGGVMEEGDLVFVVPELWVYTPLYYYLSASGPTYVGEGYAEAAAERSHGRVWLLYLDSVQWGPYGTATPAMEEALGGFTVEQEVTSRRGRARLYVQRSPRSRPRSSHPAPR